MKNRFLKCPRCIKIFFWEAFPYNPALSKVKCPHCDFLEIGHVFPIVNPGLDD
jgi:hypothetical protein